MALTQQREPSHTGDERYEVELAYDKDDVHDIEKLTPTGQVITERVILVWTRPVGGQWRRYTNGGLGSRAIGRQKIGDFMSTRGARGPLRSREVFTRELGELRSWTTYLPDLRSVVEQAEAALPK